ncbi:hypothetical protein J3A83DRAFT_4376998 [Scleroderma citrinum]
MSLNFKVHEPNADNEALLFLTSSSTGFSKAVVHTPHTLSLTVNEGDPLRNGKIMFATGVRFDHIAGLIKMHMTPLLCSAPQLHVHPSAILADPLCYLHLIEETVSTASLLLYVGWQILPLPNQPLYFIIKSIDTAFASNFLLTKLTCDLEKHSELFGTFSLSSLKWINSGGKAVVAKIAQAFSTTLKNLFNNPNWSFIISARFRMTETCTGCIYDPIDVLVTPPTHEFLELGTPIP